MNIASYWLHLNVAVRISVVVFNEYLIVLVHLLPKMLFFIFMLLLELLKLIKLGSVVSIQHIEASGPDVCINVIINSVVLKALIKLGILKWPFKLAIFILFLALFLLGFVTYLFSILLCLESEVIVFAVNKFRRLLLQIQGIRNGWN